MQIHRVPSQKSKYLLHKDLYFSVIWNSISIYQWNRQKYNERSGQIKKPKQRFLFFIQFATSTFQNLFFARRVFLNILNVLLFFCFAPYHWNWNVSLEVKTRKKSKCRKKKCDEEKQQLTYLFRHFFFVDYMLYGKWHSECCLKDEYCSILFFFFFTFTKTQKIHFFVAFYWNYIFVSMD